MSLKRAIFIWSATVLAIAVPVFAAAASPLLAWRDPAYIVAGFAGIIALGLLLLQPLLAGGVLPGLAGPKGRRVHRWTGAGAIGAIIVHVAGLWATSPPDVADALLFRSPTPFAAWGVIAMWAAFAAGLLALLRRRLRVPPTVWRRWHLSLTLLVVTGTVVHAVLIEGTMEPISKLMLCGLTLAAAIWVLISKGKRVSR
ncbi:ferric reductase-like transmembrane domain-containing protein [uncultured Roseobacter sp.]|uniref:ferric reductase-like transmembrane domain-containing protein n=1 Tax=uncultured Roseobacter sp. TaxID=114847 RepID=UPI0026151218|nr:ferric reductase-like transmembrane domain-containing protein [uncultured Roseobacter sp.]